MNRTKLVWQILIIAAFFILASCSSKHIENEQNVFKYNEAAGVVSLDPAFAKDLPHIWVCNQLFNGLVSLDDKMNVVPSIAKSWTVDEQGLIYKFSLRKDVSFHSDSVFKNEKRIVKADDFVYSLNRLVDPKLASPGAWIMNQVAKEEGKLAIKAINDTTLQIKLAHAFPAFIGLLSMTYASVVSHEAISFYKDDVRKHPVGTGPFYFKFWKEGVRLVLRRNTAYFETENGNKLPYLEAVSVSFLIDKQTAFMEFIKGQLDFMSGIDARYKDELLTPTGQLRKKYYDKIHLIRQPFLNTEYLGFYIGDELDTKTANKQLMLRKAINYGIDREKMLHYLRNNIGIAGHGGIIPAGLPGFDSLGQIGYKYNPVLARKIIKENHLEGSSLTITTTADYVDIIKFVQSSLNTLGLDIKMEVLPTASMREMRAKGQLACFRSSWVADYPDAENYLSLFYGPNKTPAGPNYTHFSNDEFNRMYDETLNESNPLIRAQKYRIMDSIMMSESPVVVLYYDEVLRFVSNRTTSLGINPSNMLDLRKVKIKLTK